MAESLARYFSRILISQTITGPNYRASPFFFLMTRPPPRSTPFPYTTLFRSHKLNPPISHDLRRSAQVSGFFHQLRKRKKFSVSREPQSRPHAWPGQRARQSPECISLDHHRDRKSTRLNSSHLVISYAVFCLK